MNEQQFNGMSEYGMRIVAKAVESITADTRARVTALERAADVLDCDGVRGNREYDSELINAARILDTTAHGFVVATEYAIRSIRTAYQNVTEDVAFNEFDKREGEGADND